MRELLQIGEVAKLVGVSAKTVRYYQEVGLLAELNRITPSGWMKYSEWCSPTASPTSAVHDRIIGWL